MKSYRFVNMIHIMNMFDFFMKLVHKPNLVHVFFCSKKKVKKKIKKIVKNARFY